MYLHCLLFVAPGGGVQLENRELVAGTSEEKESDENVQGEQEKGS